MDERNIQLEICYTSTEASKLRVEFQTVTKFTWILKTQNLQSCLNMTTCLHIKSQKNKNLCMNGNYKTSPELKNISSF